MTHPKTPPIGMTVERLVKGRWVEDWVCMVLKGTKEEPRPGVLVWGRDGDDHNPGADVWRERTTR